MKPISYTNTDGQITFNYDPVDLAEFHAHGQEYGNSGMILIDFNEHTKRKTYHCYGTIDNPNRSMVTLSLIHFDKFDGEFNPDKVVNPPVNELKGFKVGFINTTTGEIEFQELNL